MICGLPCRLSISDCFSITIIYDNMTSAYHDISLFPFTILMPSWFHLIGIALKFFPPFCFCCSWFCIWFKLTAFPFQFLPTPLNVWVQLLDPLSLNAFWTMSVLLRLTTASYWLCLQVCVTNKTLVSIGQLLSSLFSVNATHSAVVFWGITFCSLSTD